MYETLQVLRNLPQHLVEEEALVYQVISLIILSFLWAKFDRRRSVKSHWSMEVSKLILSATFKFTFLHIFTFFPAIFLFMKTVGQTERIFEEKN